MEKEGHPRPMVDSRTTPSHAVHLGFGKYRGQPLAAVPSDYLAWMLRGIPGLREALRAAVWEELRRRRGEDEGTRLEREVLAEIGEGP